MVTTSKRRTVSKSKPLPTIWEIPDDLWLRIKPILEKFWPRETHGPAPRQLEVDPQRHHLPDAVRLPVGPVADKFVLKSTVHDWFSAGVPTAWGGNPMSGRKSGVRAEIRCQFIILARKDELTSRKKLGRGG